MEAFDLEEEGAEGVGKGSPVLPNKFIFHVGRMNVVYALPACSFGKGAAKIKVKYAGLLLKHGSRVSR